MNYWGFYAVEKFLLINYGHDDTKGHLISFFVTSLPVSNSTGVLSSILSKKSY